MRIGVIGTRGFPMIQGGVEKHCEILYPQLKEDIDIVVYRRRPFVSSYAEFERISFVDLPSTRLKGFEAVFHSFISTIHALFSKYDLVHYHNIGPAMFSPILKLRKIPVVLTFHSPNYEHEKWGKLSKLILRLSEKIAFKTADKIIFVNRFQMGKYNFEIQKKSVYIPNGINKPIFPEKTDYLEKIGVKESNYILSVGRITQEKGFDTLVRAFLHSNHGDMKLVIAGSAEYEVAFSNQLKSLCKDDSVIFTGNLFGEDLFQLYSNAALYVLSSNNEGFPLVLLEAMSYGLDVVVSDIPATHLVELQPEDYFPKGDVEALSSLISKRTQSSVRRNYCLEQFDWTHIANQVSDLFERLVKDTL